jgi:hypothetical protein
VQNFRLTAEKVEKTTVFFSPEMGSCQKHAFSIFRMSHILDRSSLPEGETFETKNKNTTFSRGWILQVRLPLHRLAAQYVV